MTLAGTKKTGAGYGSQSVLRDNAVIQSKVAQAAGQLDSAHALLTRRLEEIWEASCTRGKFTLDERARLRIAIVGAMDRARDVVDFAYHASGTTAIFQGSPFERRFRDMHTLLAQGQAHLSNFEAAGLALMGVEPTQRL
jgi:alkylation response protein AidB-like acyl-CoA dehydrogenase